MATASEVTVTDEEIDELHAAIGHGVLTAADRLHVRKALAAFLAARVPEAWDENDWECAETHNALRAAVLRGPG